MRIRNNWKSMLFIVLLLLSCLSYVSVVPAQLNPIAVAGYVVDRGGTPVADGTVVTVTNEDTGVSTTTTTGLGTGLYATTILASDGDIVNASASVGTQTGINSTFVDLALVTNWINITMGNHPPVACFTYTPQYPFVDELVTFNDCSTDAGGTIISWDWTFGDGDKYSRQDASHVYDEKDCYRVTLMVTDNDGQTSTARDYICIIEDTPHIPPPQPPLVRGYTVPEMYSLLRVSDLGDSDSEITIVFLDSGVLPQTYNNISLSNIELLYHPSYINGLDAYGHGTFVAYEIAYITQTKLPNARLISYRVFDQRGKCTPDMFLTAIDDIKELHPDIVSISGGVKGNPDDIYSKKIEELRNMGIIVICAAGNNGPRSGTVLSPACSDSAIAVGASDPQWAENYTERWMIILDLFDDTICFWSARGPVVGVSPKPCIISPGESIIGIWGSTSTVKSGTSMATPLVSGGAALVLSHNKFLADLVGVIYFWDGAIIPKVFEDALKDGCTQPDAYVIDGENAWGMGIPVFTEVNNIFFWNLVMLLLIPLIIISVVIIIAIAGYLGAKKKARSKVKP